MNEAELAALLERANEAGVRLEIVGISRPLIASVRLSQPLPKRRRVAPVSISPMFISAFPMAH